MTPLLLTPAMHDAYVVLADRMARVEHNLARRKAMRPIRSAAAKLGWEGRRG